MSIWQLAFIFFMITNPIGNSPAIIALVKNHPLRKQQQILLRESFFSMLLAIFFLFAGEIFLKGLCVECHALNISGGIILLIVAFKMIFSIHNDTVENENLPDPYFVPIATPLLSGAGLLTMIMLYSAQEQNDFKLLKAIFIAWAGVIGFLVAAPYMQIIFGKRGMLALEQIMGMLLLMISMGMLVKGSTIFITRLLSVS